MGDSTGLTARVRLLREAVYNTPQSANFWDIPFLASTKLGTTQPLTNNPVIGQGRDPAQPLRAAISGGGDLVVPMDVRNFGLHLAALLGDPTTTHPSGHYQHVFNSGGLTPTPQSIEMAHPNVSEYFMNSGLFYDQMDITFAASGMPTATFTLLGTDESPGWQLGRRNARRTSTPHRRSCLFLAPDNGHQRATARRSGISCRGSLTFKNNHAASRVIANNGKISGVIPGQTALTGKISARFNDDVAAR